jgi:hypothetical protein
MSEELKTIEKIKIPKEVHTMASAIAKLAIERGLHSVETEIQVHGTRYKITWDSGRHGEEADNLSIQLKKTFLVTVSGNEWKMW